MPPKSTRGPGRPPIDNPARNTFQLRVTVGQRRSWHEAARAAGQTESEWAREGLDAWMIVSGHAAELGVNPIDLLRAALDDHARVRAAVAELASVPSRSPGEDRVFRLLAPAAWSRLAKDD
jgi:hypothetical protein